MVQRCAYYVSSSSGVLRMDLVQLDAAGPYRLIVEDATNRHIEYFANPDDALERWAEFDAAMRPDTLADLIITVQIH